eukprot:Skav214702  [mRNA]  locus=scaffold331:6683:10192:- [translate_table: standard]
MDSQYPLLNIWIWFDHHVGHAGLLATFGVRIELGSRDVEDYYSNATSKLTSARGQHGQWDGGHHLTVLKL